MKRHELGTDVSRGGTETEAVSRSAARISHPLLAELERIDDGRMPIAEVNRRLGEAAEHLGLLRPSYERVRVLVHEQRRARARPGTLAVFVDVTTRTRPPEALLDHFAGIGVPRLP
jgi:hypothetical protein